MGSDSEPFMPQQQQQTGKNKVEPLSLTDPSTTPHNLQFATTTVIVTLYVHKPSRAKSLRDSDCVTVTGDDFDPNRLPPVPHGSATYIVV